MTSLKEMHNHTIRISYHAYNIHLRGRLTWFFSHCWFEIYQWTWNGFGVRVMLFNAIFNYISVIPWRSTLSHNAISSTPRHEWDSNSQHLVMICANYIGSCKSIYHTITTTTVPTWNGIQLQKQGSIVVKYYYLK
jgi:hypothetical protein